MKDMLTGHLFPIGHLLTTCGVVELTDKAGWEHGGDAYADAVCYLNLCLKRHLHGDDGDLGEEDKQTNKEALLHGGCIFSKYSYLGKSIYIITESHTTARVNDPKADNITTILLPEEY